MRSLSFTFDDSVESIKHHAKDFIDIVQPLRFHGIDEPLRSIGVGLAPAIIGHTQQIPPVVLDSKGFVLKRLAEYAFPTRTVAMRKVYAEKSDGNRCRSELVRLAKSRV